MRRGKRLDPVAVAILLALATPVSSQRGPEADPRPWPHFLGTDSNLTVEASFFARATGVPAADVRWRRPIGPGYSQPVIDGQRAYVAFSDGSRDRLQMISLDSGEPLWDYDIGETWRGVDGSDDGPIATPTLGDGFIVGLGPRGQLFSLDSATGEERWRVDLPAEHGAEIGAYGVGTSPLLVDDRVIVQYAGGAGKSIGAFAAEDGRLLWSRGDDTVSMQSPILVKLGGVRQVLSVTGTEVAGLDPLDGSELWREKYLERAYSHGNPVAVTGPDTFVVSREEGAITFRVERAGNQWTVEEAWHSRDLKRSYAVPLALEGTLYGWSGEFFASVDAATGARNWKTRGVGPGSLLALGDWLVLWTVDGRLLFARADPAEFRKVVELQLADEGTLVNPVWTGDGLILRARDELLSVGVRMTRSSDTPEVTRGMDGVPSVLEELVAALAGLTAEERKTRIESFLDGQEVPLVEADGRVTWAFYGEAEDVALVPGGSPRESALAMTRVDGTDLWVRSEELNPQGAYVYHYQVDGEGPVLDPRNSRRASSIVPSSLLLMPDYRYPAGLDPADAEPARRGTLTDHDFHSELMGGSRNVAVYTPAGYEESRTYPLVVVSSGVDRFFGRVTSIYDATMGKTVEPAVVVFVDIADPPDMNAFYESLGGRGSLFTRMILEEILPWAEANYSVSRERERRLLLGTLLQGARSLDTALRHPGVFGAVAVQSPAMNPAFERELLRLLESVPAETPELYIDWCERDSVSKEESMDVAATLNRLVPKIRSAGLKLTAVELPGGYGWETLTTQTEAILSRFLPFSEDP